MKILWRYYVREFLKIFGIVAVGLAMIFSILDLLDKIDELERGRVTAISLGSYVFLNIPKYLYYLFPMMLLICGLFMAGQASRCRELIAFKAAGGRLRRLFIPFIFLGVVYSFLGFLIGEIVIPDFGEKTLELKKEILKSGDRLAFQKDAVWMRGTDGSLIRIGRYIPRSRIIQDISIFLTGDDSVRMRIEAGSAIWNEQQGVSGAWELRDVVMYDMEAGKIQRSPAVAFPSLESPDFFRKVTRKPEEMGIRELYDYTQRLHAAGFSNRKLLVDLNSKVSYPVANFFMLLLGVSLAVTRRAGGGLFAAGLGIAISVIYWFGYALMLSMGYAGILPPAIAAWSVPLLFAIVSFLLFRQINE
ncbi:MAG: LptF/LptG family permease [Nitrospirota bacterium]